MNRKWIFFLLLVQACILANVFVQTCLGLPNSKRTITDYSDLQKTTITDLLQPTTITEIQEIIQNAKRGPLSIAGARYSQGGQICGDGATVIDMTKLTKIVSIDLRKKTITVQAGATWRTIQDYIDPYNLSVAIMQSYNNFTIGGSLSVNIHGRYLGYGPLIQTVLSIKIVLADGSIKTASRSENSNLFFAAIGGYGALGIIVEATLQLTDNCAIERITKLMPLTDYPQYFKTTVKNNPAAQLHNADLYPDDYTKVLSTTWYKTDKEPAATRLQPYSAHPILNYIKIAAVKRIPFIQQARPLLEEKKGKELDPIVVWRNYEASYGVDDLYFPKWVSVSLLQEYFIPVDQLLVFLRELQKINAAHPINIMNISLRHVTPNNESILSWSAKESFAIVIFYDQWKTPAALRNGDIFIKKLIATALNLGGTYYLPYKLAASQQQFNQAYPQAPFFWQIKKQYDPKNIFSNQFLKTYFY